MVATPPSSIIYVNQDVEFATCDGNILVSVSGRTYCITPYRLQRAAVLAQGIVSEVVAGAAKPRPIKKPPKK